MLFTGDPLYTAILEGDFEEVEQLKAQGAKLLFDVRFIVGGVFVSHDPNDDLHKVIADFQNAVHRMSAEEFVKTMPVLREEVDMQLNLSPDIWKDIKKIMFEEGVWDCVLACFQHNMNQTLTLRKIIKANRVDMLAACVKHDWLKSPKTRDKMIDYTVSEDRPECTAFLLDYKNKNFDLAAEREKAEKKAERKLNAAPDSVAALKEIWSFKDQGLGVIITKYKGNSTVVEVPEKIGKKTVTAIGQGAFAGTLKIIGGGRTTRIATEEQMNVRRAITSIKLPDSVNYIGGLAFANMLSLTEINIPNGVYEIGFSAFQSCSSLCELFIPSSVTNIGVYAFMGCPKLTVTVERGSYAEEHCKQHDIPYTYKED